MLFESLPKSVGATVQGAVVCHAAAGPFLRAAPEFDFGSLQGIYPPTGTVFLQVLVKTIHVLCHVTCIA